MFVYRIFSYWHCPRYYSDTHVCVSDVGICYIMFKMLTLLHCDQCVVIWNVLNYIMFNIVMLHSTQCAIKWEMLTIINVALNTLLWSVTHLTISCRYSNVAHNTLLWSVTRLIISCNIVMLHTTPCYEVWHWDTQLYHVNIVMLHTTPCYEVRHSIISCKIIVMLHTSPCYEVWHWDTQLYHVNIVGNSM